MDPVYASVRLPGVFDRVDIKLDARTIQQPLVEFGMVRSLDPLQVEMQPLWSQVLDQGWREVTANQVHGYVRQDLPDSVLLSAAPDHLLTWYASTTLPGVMDATGTLQSLAVSLRGAHDFYFIPVRGAAQFDFGFRTRIAATRERRLLFNCGMMISCYKLKR